HQRSAGRRAADQEPGFTEDHRQLLALLDYGVRLYPPRDALAAAALAYRRRGLCADRVPPGAEQDHLRAGRAERLDASQGEYTEPRRLHSALPGKDAARSGARDVARSAPRKRGA